MKFSIIVLIVAAGLVSCAGDQGAQVQQNLESLTATERAFNDMSVAAGMSPAFMHYLADDGLLFRPVPTNGKDIYRENPDVPGVLTWQPRFVEVSQAGDIGYTTGPWKYWREADHSGLPGYGEYVSIWRKKADGSWELALDGGIRHTPQEWDTVLQFQHPTGAGGSDPLSPEELQEAKQLLLARDRAYSEVSKTNGKVEAFDAFMSAPFNFLRGADLPATDREYALRIMEQYVDQLTWEPDSVVVSVSGDLGYTYGIMEHRSAFYEDAPVERFAYLHIWRKEVAGDWKVALDMASRLPNPRPTEEE